MRIYLVILLLFLSTYASASYTDELKCNSMNTADLLFCIDGQSKDLDVIMNLVYKQLRLSLDAESFKELRDVQRLWLGTYKNECSNKYKNDDYGAETEIYKSICLVQQLEERNRELSIISEMNSGVYREYRVESCDMEQSQCLKEADAKWSEYIDKHCSFMKKNFNDDKCIKRNLGLHRSDFG